MEREEKGRRGVMKRKRKRKEGKEGRRGRIKANKSDHN